VVAIDSTVVRAHHHAAGARHQPPVDVAAGVLATALTEGLVCAVTSPASANDTAPAATGLTGGRIESHESPRGEGQTTRS